MTLAELQSLFSEPWNALSAPSKTLLGYGLMMLAAMLVTSIYSMTDDRSIREVGVWVKPLKFMAATALFAATTVWAIKIANSDGRCHRPQFQSSNVSS